MFLKRLDSVGFKSFAERIELEFMSGITAVVGPNGSGKSNVIDAIRWVLGEQSAKSLRGSRMEDVIFQGSDSRKSLNIAEVTITLDNSRKKIALPYEEISITRRVYRSGESEFYINKKACRLKDILELFLDSGLGREAFSIISQGRVEEVLSSKPEERRAIFEEAAGVLKYKQRKIKAEFKLTETEHNLSRVKDIFHEIEQQVEPLKIKAKTARLYLEKKARLKKEEISLMVTEIELLHNEWKITQDRSKELEFIQLEYQANRTKLEKQIEIKQEENMTTDIKIEKAQNILLANTEKLEQLQTKSQVFSVRSEHATENKERINKEISQMDKRETLLIKEFEDTRKILDELIANKNSLIDSIKELQNELKQSPEETSIQLNHLKTNYIKTLNKRAAFNNELKSISNQQEVLQRKYVNSTDQLSLLREDFKELTNKFKIYNEKETHLKNNIIESERTVENTLNQFEKLKNEKDKMKENIEHLKNNIDKSVTRRNLLKEMKADFQGFYAGTKQILQASKTNNLQGIYGAVIQLINIPLDYLQAIEVILGGSAQHIITKNNRSAREAITWLKNTNSGRATFLPLNIIKSRIISKENLSKIKVDPGYVGVANELVEYDNKYSQAIEHLMGHVIVTKTLEDANTIASKLKNRYRIVTMAGDVVSPGGAISGGAIKKNNQSLFTREKDLIEIKEQLILMRDEKQVHEAELSIKNNDLNDIASKLKNFQEQVGKEKIIYHETMEKLKNIEHKYDLINQQMRAYEMDKEQSHNEVVEIEKRHKLIIQKQQEQADLVTKQNKKIEQIENKQKNYVDDMKKKRNFLHEKELKSAKLNERELNLEKQTKKYELQLHELTSQRQELQLKLQANFKIENAEEIQMQLISEMDEKETEKINQTEKISRLRRKRLQETQEIEHLTRQIKEQTKLINQLIKTNQENEISINRLDVQLDYYLKHLQTEYTMTYEKATLNYSKCTDIKDAKKSVEKTKTSIDELGFVHLGAIEEYKEIYSRYHFLEEQQQDLKNAKGTLKEAIKEMDEEMAKLFLETFVAIQKQFSIVFSELFGGGYAELKLINPDSLLETGIDIIAQPPGKKLKHLSLLSGGERALTAIALLFSILRVRPVPFCILDEVEAALDEANVQRFARYLHQYSDETQFIVITHRKGTMEEADVLYGITMQESGVSRVVSVRLNDKKELLPIEGMN